MMIAGMTEDRNWALKRRGFHCWCERCLAGLGRLARKRGKFWQARYGESALAFRKRYRAAHQREAL